MFLQKTDVIASAKFEDFVRYASFFFRSMGVQPYQLYGSKPSNGCIDLLVRGFVFYAGIGNLLVCVVAEFTYTLLAIKNNQFVAAVMTLSYVGFVCVGLMKLSYMWYKRDQLNEFMMGLQAIFPTTNTAQEQLQVPRYLRQCTIVTRTFSLLYMVLIWTYNLYAMMEYFIYDSWLHVRVVEQELPYTYYIPWNWHGHWSYYPLYGIQIMAGYVSAAGQISSDLLLSAVATQMVMHYDHIARSIGSYKGGVAEVKEGEPGWYTTEYALHEENVKRKDMEFLINTIRYHATLLRLSEMMNDVFGVPLLFNFMTSTFVICFVGFQMTIGVAPDLLFKLMLFFFASMTQVYLICHYGQLLIDSSVNVAQAVFQHDWTHTDVNYQKMLALMLQRSHRPAWLKATSFMRVSRGSMTDIMQISYKFFALIRTMYTD